MTEKKFTLTSTNNEIFKALNELLNKIHQSNQKNPNSEHENSLLK